MTHLHIQVVAGKSRHGDNYLATMWALSLNAETLQDGMKGEQLQASLKISFTDTRHLSLKGTF